MDSPNNDKVEQNSILLWKQSGYAASPAVLGRLTAFPTKAEKEVR